ncbi:MAG: hypothetical protein U7123_26890 [Potamolinea sp.]
MAEFQLTELVGKCLDVEIWAKYSKVEAFVLVPKYWAITHQVTTQVLTLKKVANAHKSTEVGDFLL